jgi:hypothetical protein
MRFHLVYHGPLQGSGNKSKPDEVRNIRDQFHIQLKYLWETSSTLRMLMQKAIVPKSDQYAGMAQADSPFSTQRDLAIYPARDGEVDLCGPIEINGKKFVSLVRKSLSSVCLLNISFLRQEDPGALILQGGDIDNRIKTLFDALRNPEAGVERNYPQSQDLTYCLLESDTLISGFEISTGRLLFPQSGHPNEVHLLIEVEVRVLEVGTWNLPLVGG